MARRGTEKWREQEWGDACATAKVTIDWIKADPSYGQKLVRLTVDRRAVPAFRALAEVFVRWRYVIDPTQTGAFNCRHIGSDPKKPWSSHAWATAVDVNWQQNPDGSRLVTNMPQGMLDEIDAIVCADGTPVWRWGGDWDRDPSTPEGYYDAMHFELWSTPAELAAGPLTDPSEEDEMSITRLIRIEGSGTVYVCDGTELRPVTDAKVADEMWPGWRKPGFVLEVKKTSVLAKLPKRNPQR